MCVNDQFNMPQVEQTHLSSTRMHFTWRRQLWSIDMIAVVCLCGWSILDFVCVLICSTHTLLRAFRGVNKKCFGPFYSLLWQKQIDLLHLHVLSHTQHIAHWHLTWIGKWYYWVQNQKIKEKYGATDGWEDVDSLVCSNVPFYLYHSTVSANTAVAAKWKPAL